MAQSIGIIKSSLMDSNGENPNEAEAKLKTMPTMSKLTAAYLAGLVDGEGSMRLKQNKAAGGYYTPQLRMAMVNKEIISWCCNSFGGHVEERRFDNPVFNTAYSWVIGGETLEAVLRSIYPYLRLKKRHCEILLRKFNLAKRMTKKGWCNRYDENSKIEINKLVEEIKFLNIRGRKQLLHRERSKRDDPSGVQCSDLVGIGTTS